MKLISRSSLAIIASLVIGISAGAQVTGGPGNAPGPVYGSPVYHGYPPSPAYPSPPSFPPPVHSDGGYPTGNYPGNYPQQAGGACTVRTTYNYGGPVYTAYDGYGNVLITTPSYSEAYQEAQNAVYNRSCSYVSSDGNQGGGYGYPNQNYCQIMPGQNAYGQQFYRVVDSSGRIILNTSSYREAQIEMQNNQQCYEQD